MLFDKDTDEPSELSQRIKALGNLPNIDTTERQQGQYKGNTPRGFLEDMFVVKQLSGQSHL